MYEARRALWPRMGRPWIFLDDETPAVSVWGAGEGSMWIASVRFWFCVVVDVVVVGVGTVTRITGSVVPDAAVWMAKVFGAVSGLFVLETPDDKGPSTGVVVSTGVCASMGVVVPDGVVVPVPRGRLGGRPRPRFIGIRFATASVIDWVVGTMEEAEEVDEARFPVVSGTLFGSVDPVPVSVELAATTFLRAPTFLRFTIVEATVLSISNSPSSIFNTSPYLINPSSLLHSARAFNATDRGSSVLERETHDCETNNTDKINLTKID